jgi:hypothetical protein
VIAQGLRPGPSGALAAAAVAGLAVTASAAAGALSVGHAGSVVPAIAGVLVGAVCITAFWRVPHVAFAALAVFLMVQPTLRFFVSEQFGPAKDVAIIAAAMGTVLARTVQRRRDVPPMDAWLVSGIAVFLALYVADPAGAHGDEWAFGVRLVLEAFGLFLMGMAAPDPRRSWRYLAVGIVVSTSLIAVWGLGQQLIGYVRLVEDFGYTYGAEVRQTATGQFRSFGTLDDPFSFATLLLLGLAVATLARPTRWWGLAAAIIVAGVLASFVRTGLVILVLLGAIALVQRRELPSAFGFLSAAFLAAGLLLVLFPQTSPSFGGTREFVLTLNGRTEGWAAVIRAPGELLAGRGVGVIGSGAARAANDPDERREGAAPVLPTQQFQQYNIDSSFFATVADVGLIGFALLLALFARTAVLARRAMSRGSPTSWVVVGAGAVILTDGLTRASLTSFPVGFIAMLVLGTALAAALAEAGAGSTRPPAGDPPQRG